MIHNMSAVDKTSASVGGGTAFFGAIATNEVALWVGIIATVLTFCASLFWNWRRDKREERRLAYEIGLKEDRRTESVDVHADRRA